MYSQYITKENEVLVFFDFEIYDREPFYAHFKLYLEAVCKFDGYLIFDGSASLSLVGDLTPRTILYIFKWANLEMFNRWWNSAQNFRLKQDLFDFSDVNVTVITQNPYHDKYRLE
ncbi:MAG: hypothetical protein WCP69_01180 [Bacteroidota bacterium]